MRCIGNGQIKVSSVECNFKFFFLRGKNPELNPQTLPHNFGLMGGAFDGKLNRNSERNDEAMSGGSILDSHFIVWFAK